MGKCRGVFGGVHLLETARRQVPVGMTKKLAEGDDSTKWAQLLY